MTIRYGLIGGTQTLDARLRQLLDNVAFNVGTWPDLFTPIAAIDEAGLQVLFINSEKSFDDAIRVAQDLQSHNLELVMLGQSDDTRQLRAAMRAGCRDFAHPQHDGARIVELISELAPQVVEDPRSLGDVLGVLGCRGGIGVTTIALGLASLLAQDKRNAAVLIDVDQAGGDLLAAVDVRGNYTTHDLLGTVDRVDVAKIRNAVVRREGGVWVLPQPEEDLDTVTVTEHDVGPLIATVRRAFTHVVVDMGHAFHGAGRELVKDLHKVVLVADQEIVTLRATVRRLRLLRSMGVEDRDIVVVLSRYNARRKPGRDEISKQLQHEVAATISSDYEAVSSAMNRGGSVVEISPRAEVTEDLRFLKGALLGEKVEKKARGWWLSR